MPQNVRFDEFRGATLFDPKTKSSYNGVAQFCKDLKKCGGTTHIFTQLGFAVNARVNCAPPVQGLAHQRSGYASVLPHTADTLNTGGIAGSPVSDVTMGFVDLMRWAFDSLTTPLLTPANAQTRFGGAESFWEYNANGIQYYDQNLKYIAASVGFPIRKPIVDNCGVPLGSTYSVSGSVNGFDLETCQPVLLWQGSVSTFVNTGLYGGLPAGVDTVISDVENNLWAAEIGNIAIPGTGFNVAGCANLFAGIRTRRDAHISEVTTIGI